jgi:hypothetical protein
MEAPQNISQLRSFIGLVTYYRSMWPRRSHILAPLTELTGAKKFHWLPKHQEAFEAMKAMAASDALLRYPDHNKPFDIETDSSDYQLGAVIKQDGVPVAYYSRKLTSAQRNYTTIEKELLSIVETLKTFRSMLLGAVLRIHTDHKNLTHELTAFQTQRVLRWRLYLEEYGPQFLYKTGKTNYVADALSRTPTSRTSPLGGEEQSSSFDEEHPDLDDNAYSLIDEPDLTECLLLHPQFDEQGSFPLRYDILRAYQELEPELMQAGTDHTMPQFKLQTFADVELVVYSPPENPALWRICIPTGMLEQLVRWYHITLSHAGMTRLGATISRHCYHPKLRRCIEELVGTCDACQRYKAGGRSAYGELPQRDIREAPWYEVQVDLIGVTILSSWRCIG